MKDQHDSEQDWSGNLEGAAESNDRQHEQAEHRKRRPSSPRRKKKSKHHSKKKKKKRRDERTAREKELIQNDAKLAPAGVASIPPAGTRNDNDSSFPNLLATFTDQNDVVCTKGTIRILCLSFLYSFILSHHHYCVT